MEICSRKKCTACQACKVVCPQEAITFENDKHGNYLPNIDEGVCINCNKCVKVCPNNHLQKKDYQEPFIAYAAWTPNSMDRSAAASGGVATFLQRKALDYGMITYGVGDGFAKMYEFNRIHNEQELYSAMNSKYAYSSAYETILDIDMQLKAGKKALFIGMPCQVAAIRSIFKNSNDSLLLIDLICHGMPPAKYYLEHCNYLQSIYKKNIITNIRFRTNNNYDLTLNTQEREVFTRNRYKDLYAVGFHGSAIYQESCYSCNYACSQRISDITLGDFWGLEEDSKLASDVPKGITAILVNTNRGAEYLKVLGVGLIMSERNPAEVIEHNGQLQKPPVKNRYRKVFVEKYTQYGFEEAARRSFRLLAVKQKIGSYRSVKSIRKIIKVVLKK